MTADETPARRLFEANPLLAAALEEARRRFAEVEGVCGFGLGRPYSDGRGEYESPPAATEGLAVKIFVRRKRPTSEIPPGERLPKSLLVTDPRTGLRRRVRLDVRAVGRVVETGGRGWPTAGGVQPGRLLASTTDQVQQESGAFPDTKSSRALGTVGAVFEINGRRYAVSAGHVFCDYCRSGRGFDRPGGALGVGVFERSWRRVGPRSFRPASLRAGDVVTDAMLFTVPDDLVLEPFLWPAGFHGRFAALEDVAAALAATGASGRILVERKPGGLPRALPVRIDLEEALQVFTPEDFRCAAAPLTYGFVWKSGFEEPQRSDHPTATIAGDSGAPLFIEAASDPAELRLLGFHFLHNRIERKSYAVDAETFVRSVLSFEGDPPFAR